MAYGESDNYNANLTGPQPSRLITPSTMGVKALATLSVANAARKSITIQNQGQNVLFVKLGDSADTNSFHFTLKAGAANDDGTGGTLDLDKYTGEITVAGTSPRYTYVEFV